MQVFKMYPKMSMSESQIKILKEKSKNNFIVYDIIERYNEEHKKRG